MSTPRIVQTDGSLFRCPFQALKSIFNSCRSVRNFIVSYPETLFFEVHQSSLELTRTNSKKCWRHLWAQLGRLQHPAPPRACIGRGRLLGLLAWESTEQRLHGSGSVGVFAPPMW